jgi:L-fuconolactonase
MGESDCDYLIFSKSIMNIVDAHVHFWDPQKLRYTWLDNEPRLNHTFLADHVPARVNGAIVEGIVFVQADCAPEQGIAEIEFVNALAAHDARIRGIVAFAPLEQGAAVRAYLDRVKAFPLVKGVRRLIQDELPGFGTHPQFTTGVECLAEYNFTFDICIRHWQLADASELVRACPGVNFVLDHAGKPDIRNQIRKPWRTQISELAALPNVSCKISGLVTEANHETWTLRDLQPYIEHVLQAFGTDRVMFGSDAPVAYLASTYERWVETLQAATSHLSPSAQDALWYTNAKKFYRLS